ncbi:unannotated protein [freshwater metagenome]|uniref:Unannotated protein n=1 Tax=freshwater metagenome TaxID=449393 RepID=A0A6J7I4U5_9ZZZZ|nr:hypothetical protein [Actinomycetota bacterium]
MRLESLSSNSITALCGGLGGARLALALGQLAAEATFITNVGDDWSVGELLVCPDTDAVIYALAGLFDEDRGWGVRDDVFPGPRENEPPWFGLGVRDRQHHELRHELLLGGSDLADATATIVRGLGISARVIPVTGDPNPTCIDTSQGRLAFQEWLVRDRAQPQVTQVEWPGSAVAAPSRDVLMSIETAGVVVISSSSPVASIEPSLRVPGVREALIARKERGGRTVGISPIVSGHLAVGPRDTHRAHARETLMRAMGMTPDLAGIADWISPWASHMIIDPVDAFAAKVLERSDLEVSIAPILDQDAKSRAELVATVLSSTPRSV